MAVIYEGVICSLCQQAIDIKYAFFATSGAFLPPDHPLFAYCDAPLHWECYENWPRQREFAREYFRSCVESDRNNPYWSSVFLSEDIYVSVNPGPRIEIVSVYIAATGSGIRIPLKSWQLWIKDHWTATIELRDIEKQALRDVWQELQFALPDQQTLLNAVDWEERRRLFDIYKEQTRRSEEERLHKPSAHNKACRIFLRRGVRCPYCENAGAVQFINKGPMDKSYFLCGTCEQSFGPVELTLKQIHG